MEEQAIKVSVQEDGYMKNMDDNGSEFCSIHVHLQPYYPWEDENTSPAYGDYKMKGNCEGDEFTPSFSVGDHNIIAKGCAVINGIKEYFGSDQK